MLLVATRIFAAAAGLGKIFLVNHFFHDSGDSKIFIAAISFYAISSSIGFGWLNNSMIRFPFEISSAFKSASFNLALAVSVIVTASISFLTAVLSKADPSFLMILWICAQGICYFIPIVLVSKKNYTSFAIYSSVIAIVDVISIAAMRQQDLSLVFLLSSAIYTLIFLFFYLKIQSPAEKFDSRQALVYSLPLSVSLFATSTLIHIDRIILSQYSPGSLLIFYITCSSLIDQAASIYIQSQNQILQSQIYNTEESGLYSIKTINIIQSYHVKIIYFSMFVALVSYIIALTAFHLKIINYTQFQIVIPICISILLYRSSQIINKYYEIYKKTAQFMAINIAILAVKVLVALGLLRYLSPIAAVSSSAVIASLLLYLIMLKSLIRMKSLARSDTLGAQ